MSDLETRSRHFALGRPRGADEAIADKAITDAIDKHDEQGQDDEDASGPGVQPRQRPTLAGPAGGEVSRGDRTPDEPAEDSGRGAADDNGII